MGRRKSINLEQAVFEAASTEVVKQIDRIKLHSIPHLGLSDQYDLYKVLKIKRSRRPWKKPTYTPLNMSLKRMMGDFEGVSRLSLWQEADTLEAFKVTTQPVTPGAHVYRTLWHEFDYAEDGVTLEDDVDTAAFIKSTRKYKIQCELGPMEREALADLNQLQEWVSERNVNYNDPSMKSISIMKNEYMEGRSMNALCVITSIYRLTEDGKVVTVSPSYIQHTAHSLEAVSRDNVEDDERTVLAIPKDTIIAYGVNELYLDKDGCVSIAPHMYSQGKFMARLSDLSLGVQELVPHRDDELDDINERTVWSSLDPGVRGSKGLLKRLCCSPDLDIVCELIDLREEEMNEAVEIDTSSVGYDMKMLLQKMSVTFDNINDTVKLSHALSYVITAVDELNDSQLLAILNLSQEEATAAIDKVMRDNLFVDKRKITLLPPELNTGSGLQLLWQLNFKMVAGGVVLVDETALPVQSELVTARILMRALYEMPPDCGAEVEIEWDQGIRPLLNDDDTQSALEDAAPEEISLLDSGEDVNCTKQLIDESGGDITLGSVSLHIPADTVDYPVLITLSKTNLETEGYIHQNQETEWNYFPNAGISVQVQPVGYQFSRPASLRLHNVNRTSTQQLRVKYKDVSAESDPPWVQVSEHTSPKLDKNDVLCEVKSCSTFQISLMNSPRPIIRAEVRVLPLTRGRSISELRSASLFQTLKVVVPVITVTFLSGMVMGAAITVAPVISATFATAALTGTILLSQM